MLIISLLDILFNLIEYYIYKKYYIKRNKIKFDSNLHNFESFESKLRFESLFRIEESWQWIENSRNWNHSEFYENWLPILSDSHIIERFYKSDLIIFVRFRIAILSKQTLKLIAMQIFKAIFRCWNIWSDGFKAVNKYWKRDMI